MYGITLILTLATVGGVIAYIGDRLGMNVGRKKLTLFGLRPKHTSILVTIVTGVLIVSASLGILSIASQDVRTALFRMKQIQGELKDLQSDYAVMKGQRDSAQHDLQEAESRVQEAEASYERMIASLAEAEQDVSVLEARAVVLQDEVLELQAKTEELRENYELVSKDYQLVSTAFGQIRGANIAFQASEVILTTTLKKGLSRAEIAAALEHFMQEVDQVAYSRSARVEEPQIYRSIYVQPGVLDFAVEDVLLAPGDVIVRAVSESNTIPGVPVVVYLENYLDQMVFSKGTVLAASNWDPASGVEIDRVILQILSEANGAALEAGVALSKERGAAVILPGDDFLNTIYTSRNIEKPVQIRLVASEDTWRSEAPMEVHLDIVD